MPEVGLAHAAIERERSGELLARGLVAGLARRDLERVERFQSLRPGLPFDLRFGLVEELGKALRGERSGDSEKKDRNSDTKWIHGGREFQVRATALIVGNRDHFGTPFMRRAASRNASARGSRCSTATP